MAYERSKRHAIPIYDVAVEVVLTDSIKRSAEDPERSKRLQGDGAEDWQGLVSSNDEEIAIFFDATKINHSVIAHEVFHATLRIMEHIDHRLDDDHHEPAAYLCGYLTKIVYDDLRSWQRLTPLRGRIGRGK